MTATRVKVLISVSVKNSNTWKITRWSNSVTIWNSLFCIRFRANFMCKFCEISSHRVGTLRYHSKWLVYITYRISCTLISMRNRHRDRLDVDVDPIRIVDSDWLLYSVSGVGIFSENSHRDVKLDGVVVVVGIILRLCRVSGRNCVTSAIKRWRIMTSLVGILGKRKKTSRPMAIANRMQQAQMLKKTLKLVNTSSSQTYLQWQKVIMRTSITSKMMCGRWERRSDYFRKTS